MNYSKAYAYEKPVRKIPSFYEKIHNQPIQ